MYSLSFFSSPYFGNKYNYLRNYFLLYRNALFCAIYNGTKYADAAQALYNELKLKSKPLEDNLGKGLSNPAFMGQMIIDTPVENKQALSDKLLQGVRVLPNINQFKRCVQAWSKTALKGISN